MDRDMSYELDGVFSGRNAGELIAERPVRTRITRAPGLTPVGRLPGGDVRNISPELAHKMAFAAPKNITAHRTKSLHLGMGKNLNPAFYHAGTDLADDDADMPFEGVGTINLPVIGAVSVSGLALAIGIGFAAFKLLKR